METVTVRGGTRLVGEVAVNGSKYVGLSAIPAVILAKRPCIIENLPDVSDVRVFCDIMRNMGARVEYAGGVAAIDAQGLTSIAPPAALVKRLRASYYLMGALLGRYGQAEVPLPGGDDIGPRPIDQHLKGFRALGADVAIEHGIVKLSAAKLMGAPIYLDVVSVGATINIMLAAIFAEGVTTMVNVDRGPWIIDLANMLNAMGARIFGAGTETLRIQGVQELGGCQHSIIPDQSEAATLMIASAITGGDVVVKDVITDHLDAVIAKLRETGAVVVPGQGLVRVIGPSRPTAVNVKTLPYPGFFTDFQAPMSTMLTKAEGMSIVTETIWDERFKHLEELTKMGAKARIEGRNAIIEGVPELSSAEVTGTDLRASASLVLAGLVADGETTVHGVEHMDRGYQRLDEKLIRLGGDIRRI